MKHSIFTRLSEHPEFQTFCDLGRSLFGAKVSIGNPEGTQGVSKEQTPFCQAVQKSPWVDNQCLKCGYRHLKKARRLKKPLSYTCHFGLTEFAVPVLVDNEIVAFLWCGQVFNKKPTREQWLRVRNTLDGHGLDLDRIEKLFFKTKVISKRQQGEMMQMFDIFANHLAFACHRISILEQRNNSKCVMLAKSYIKTHLEETLSLDDIARATYSSKRNLTRVFCAETGAPVMDYIRRLRVDRACDLLRDTDQTIAAVAFESGCGTIQQFNRIFKAIKKCSPSAWRKQTRQ